ncbi:MAG: carboxypeptidase-like regulatory domain-containing protein [Maribacter sp.]|uniref:carboxypeptidase-like regulatory domain-containing protein n=1 Tax=Maribacter sp. TaxID=1897614 RepID=UPI003C735DFB
MDFFKLNRSTLIKAMVLPLFLIFHLGYAQIEVEGYVLDEVNQEPLPYATIRLVNVNSYTITNEDGEFRLFSLKKADSLEVTYIGFEKKRVPLSHFKTTPYLYLRPNIEALNEVTLVAFPENKDYAFDLLNSLVKKYRQKEAVSNCKAFLTLTSSARDIPIEQIEGFYNAEQSLSGGILDLDIKSGRFGQNKSFPFYSLDNTKILSDFQFFKSSSQILPFYPGNMSSSYTKRIYKITIDPCHNCTKGDMSISFAPVKSETRYFSGKILFNRSTLIIKKIELWINNPETKKLTSINKSVKIWPKEIKLEIVFNPLDLEKIQYLNFDFSVNYEYMTSKEIIESHTLVYFYDYNTSFDEPYFTIPVQFKNDYDKIIALQATDDFWNTNFQFPQSIREKRSMEFMKHYGYLINYDNTIPADHIVYTKPSVVSWNRDKRLAWKIIKQDIATEIINDNPSETEVWGTEKADRVYHSSSEMIRGMTSMEVEQEYVFSYVLDQYKDEGGRNKYVVKTLFDRYSSFCRHSRTKNKLVYVNIMFDIYEYYRQLLEAQIYPGMTFEEAIIQCDEKFKEATLMEKKIQKETSSGLNYQNLIQWNNQIRSKLNIDNFAVVE